MEKDINFEENKKKIKEIQNIVLGMLCDIDMFCKENNILYFLSGGTCLGAIRHKGFIPWDDDADIMMPRPDFERFVSSFNDSPLSLKYGIGSLSLGDKWMLKHGKIWDKRTTLKYNNMAIDDIGLFIDIFPIDGLPSNPLVRKIHFIISKSLCGLGNSCRRTSFVENEGHKVLKSIVHFFTRRISPRFFFKLMDNHARKYKFNDSKYVGAIMAAHYGARETIERKCMCEPVECMFEGRMFPVPIGYDTYLKNLYGDYLKVPEDAAEKGYIHLSGWELTINE